MSFFYDLNKKLNGLRAEDKQITESVAKAAAEVKTPARVTLEESLKQDMKALMEGQVNEISKDTKDSYAKKAKTELDIYNRNKNNPAQSVKGKEVAAKSAAKREKGLEKVKEDGTGGMNFSGSGSLEEKAGYSAKKAAAGKDIGKPGKNFAKIEKSAGGGEKGKKIAGAVLAKLRAAKESVEEASMEMEAGAGGIHGSMPDPMSQKDQQRKMNPPRSLEETDKDIMEFLRSKLGHAEPHAYNAGSGKPDAHNGMEFEGNAFTGKLASTPKGGEFSVGGEEFTDTSSLEEAVSRKHFQQVADLLRNIPDEAKRKEMAMHHASIFAQQNPRFDMRRFGQACGVDLEECAMWEELKGGQHKLDVDHDGDIGSDDLADLRSGQEVTDEGFADMDAWLAQREKAKGTGKFDSRKVSTGTVYTRKPETFGSEEGDDTGEPAVKRGRGRPAVAKKPERVTGKAWKHKGGRMQEEGAEETVDEEKAEAGKRHFFDKLAPAAKKVAKVVSKVAGDKKEEKEAPKKDSKAAPKKDSKPAEKKEAPKKDSKPAEKKDDKKEEKVEETTTSGSVATASTSKKSNGMGIGQGIYDSIERDFERLLAEAVSVKQEAMMDENTEGSEAETITITASGDDVAKLKAALQSMGISQPTPAEELHSEEPCGSCGGVPCQCDDMSCNADQGLPGEIEIEVVEADAPVTQNSPDYPTNQECSDDPFQYSGGLNKPKSTGQATTPILASQEERQVAESSSFYSLVKAILLK